MAVVTLRLVLAACCVLLASLADAQSSSCEMAAYVPPPYVERVVGGTTAGADLSNDGCSGGQPSNTFRITPSMGNRVTIKACGPLTVENFLRVTVFTGGCSSATCVDYERLPASHQCVTDMERIEFEASERDYWIVVESDSNDSGDGQYSLSINEGVFQTPLPGCEDAISVPGPYSPPVTFYSSVGPLPSDDNNDDSDWVTVNVIDSFDIGNAQFNLVVDDDDDVPLEDGTSLPGTSWDSRDVACAVLGGVAGASVEVTVGHGLWTTTCNDLAYCASAVAYESSGSKNVLQGPAVGWRVSYSATGAGQILISAIDYAEKQGLSSIDFVDCTDCEAVATFSDFSQDVDLTNLVYLIIEVVGSDIFVEVTEFAVVAQAELQRSVEMASSVTLPCSDEPVRTQLGWYKIYPSGGEVTVSTCTTEASAPTTVDVFLGDCSDFSCIGYTYSRMCTTGTVVSFNAYAPMYYVAISGRYGATGSYQLTIEEDPFSFISTWVPSRSPISWFTPTSIGWQSPSVWESTAEEWSYSTGFGSSCNDPIYATYGASSTTYNSGLMYRNFCGLYTSSQSAWFSFTPMTTDRVSIDTCSTNFDTVLAVVSDCGSLSCLAHNDDNCSNWGSKVTINVTGGREYLIFVAGYGSDRGSFELTIQSV